MKRTAFAALLLSALLGGQAMADTGPTNPNPTTAPGATGMGSGVPPEIPVPGSTDPRTQGSDPGRQGGATTDGTDRSKRPETMDDHGTERGNERNGSGMGGTGTGSSGSGSSTGSGTGSGSGQ